MFIQEHVQYRPPINLHPLSTVLYLYKHWSFFLKYTYLAPFSFSYTYYCFLFIFEGLKVPTNFFKKTNYLEIIRVTDCHGLIDLTEQMLQVASQSDSKVNLFLLVYIPEIVPLQKEAGTTTYRIWVLGNPTTIKPVTFSL